MRKSKQWGDPNQFITPCQFLPITPTKTELRQADRGMEVGGGEARGETVTDVDREISADKTR